MNNKLKTRLQQQEFELLKEQQRVLLKWATGCGKSKMTIDLVNYAALKMGERYILPRRALFVVAERAHISNWQNEFEKWHLRFDKMMIDMCCYASLKKYKDYRYDLVILDEGHHCFTEKRVAALEELKENLMPNAHVYLLSATLSSGKQDIIEEVFGKFATSTISLKDAIQNDILSDPKVYVIGMELDNKKENQEIKVNKADSHSPVVSWEKRFKYLGKNEPCIIRCTERQKYIYYTDTMEYWKQRYERSKNQFQHNLWVNTGSQRKRFLGELKTEYIKTIVNNISGKKRFVCFCASVNQANEIDCVNTISSKRPVKSNQLIIDKFNNKQLDRIFAVGMITEGMNLTDIQAGIITQLDGKERLFIQKFGRMLRADSPITFIFYYKDTQDENYLRGALENVDSKYIQHININDLNNIRL